MSEQWPQWVRDIYAEMAEEHYREEVAHEARLKRDHPEVPWADYICAKCSKARGALLGVRRHNVGLAIGIEHLQFAANPTRPFMEVVR